MTAYLLRFVTLGLIVPVTMSVIVYVGFATNYSQNIFSRGGFDRQYSSGVYKYRVAGSYLLLRIDELVGKAHIKGYGPKALKTLDAEGTPHFYLAYFLLNTAALCGVCTVLFRLFDVYSCAEPFVDDVAVLFACLLVAITEFVVTPYDVLSYLLLVAAAYFSLRANTPRLLNPVLLAATVFLATLTRESAALILSFYFAVHSPSLLRWPGRARLNANQWEILVLAGIFLLTYVSLRIFLGFDHAAFQDYRLFRNLEPLPALGLLFFGSLTAVLTSGGGRASKLLMLAAIPYIVGMIFVADTWEIRLWVPLILLLIITRLVSDQSTRRAAVLSA